MSYQEILSEGWQQFDNLESSYEIIKEKSDKNGT